MNLRRQVSRFGCCGFNRPILLFIHTLKNPASGPDGLPVVSLPYLALMKMRAGRAAIDIGDLSRVLGAADKDILVQTQAVMAAYLPDGLEDLESLIQLGRLEFTPSHLVLIIPVGIRRLG